MCVHELSSVVRFRVMRRGKVDIEQVDLREDASAAKISRQASSYQLCVSVNDLLDPLAREGLRVPEAALDVVQDAWVGGVRLVQETLRHKVCLLKPVTEVLRGNSATVCSCELSECIPRR